MNVHFSSPLYLTLLEASGNDLKVTHHKCRIDQLSVAPLALDDYYPFGLTFNSYQRPSGKKNDWKFQGQEHIDLTGWDSFKWRNHQPDIGRFFNVDPLADKYVYNSPYAFSENKVVAHIELEGLEAISIEFAGRGIAPVGGVVGVSANGGVGITFGTSKNNDGLYAVSYATSGFGLGSGEGLIGGLSFYGHEGNIEDTEGLALSIGGFLAVGKETASAEAFTTLDGTDFGTTIPIPKINFGLGGGGYAEISSTVFFGEPVNLSNYSDNEMEKFAKNLNISVDELNNYINMANDYINSVNESKSESFNNKMEQFEKELKNGYTVPSDNTKTSNN